MRKAAKQILICAAGLILFCVVCRFTLFNRFSVYIPLTDVPEASAAEADNRPQVRFAGIRVKNGAYEIPVFVEGPGRAEIKVGKEGTEHVLEVDRLNTVYDRTTGNFTGDAAVLIAVTVFWLLVSAIMVWHFTRAKGPAFYDYGTIYYAGFSIFALATALVLLNVTVSHLVHPESYSMYSAYSAISGASIRYMQLTTPLMLVFAGAMAVSNIVLLRHERPRPQNYLALLVAGLLVLGEAVGWFLFSRDFSGPETGNRVAAILVNTYATVFVYFQCMLTGAVICGVMAARHTPSLDKDFVIILGCWFRKDGTLPPLLRSRTDKALSFWRQQKESAGREACFIPSGGQGKNETMPEAEAMSRYLLEQGVCGDVILPEKESKNTYQNMVFSDRIIRDTNPAGKAVFATSNYHVFRSGVLARQAGLSYEGIGAKTKWWFWPNAFMRETAGLLQKRWKQELLFLVVLVAYFGLLSMILW